MSWLSRQRVFGGFFPCWVSLATSCSASLSTFYCGVRVWTKNLKLLCGVDDVRILTEWLLEAQKLRYHSPFTTSSETSSSRFLSSCFNFFASLPPTPERRRLYSATLGSASVRVFNVEIYQPRVTNLAEDFSLPILSSCLCLTTHSVGGALWVSERAPTRQYDTKYNIS